MATDLIAEASIEIAAPVARVWAALTEPALVKQYFFGTEMATDWKVGSPITYRGEWEGKPYEDLGTVLEFEPQRHLAFSYWSNFSGVADTPENRQRIDQHVEDRGGSTLVTMSQDNVPNEEARDHSAANWAMVLGEMKKLLEGGA